MKTEEIKQTMSLSEMVKVYNDLADKPISRFRDKDTGAKRLAALMEQHKSNRGRKPKWPDHKQIKLEVRENPKREDTKSHERFALYFRSDVQTIGDYVAKGGRRSDIDWDIDKGFIVLDDS